MSLGAVAIIEAAGGRVSEYLVADALQSVALICGFHFKEQVSQVESELSKAATLRSLSGIPADRRFPDTKGHRVFP